MLLNIFEESKIRGTHSFGYSAQEPKRFHSLDKMKASLSADWPLSALVGHNRYSTGEGWKNIEDCQPISRGGRSMAFNGVINMASPSSWSSVYKTDFTTANDVEIALVELERGNFDQVLAANKVSFAGAWLEDGTVKYARNPRRPLWRGEWSGASFLASTFDIFRRAGFKGEVAEVLPMRVYELN